MLIRLIEPHASTGWVPGDPNGWYNSMLVYTVLAAAAIVAAVAMTGLATMAAKGARSYHPINALRAILAATFGLLAIATVALFAVAPPLGLYGTDNSAQRENADWANSQAIEKYITTSSTPPQDPQRLDWKTLAHGGMATYPLADNGGCMIATNLDEPLVLRIELVCNGERIESTTPQPAEIASTTR